MDIKKRIKDSGYTLEQVASKMRRARGAKEVGISQPTLSAIINGNPTLDRLREIASIIGISVSDLLADDNSGVEVTCPHCGNKLSISLKLDVTN